MGGKVVKIEGMR